MKNLITFGCSCTYGHGLVDCFENLENASKYAWPAVLGNMLGANVFNYAQPGASNMEIFHRILNRVPDQDDCYVIMWTYPEREMLFDTKYIPESVFNQIRPNKSFSKTEEATIRLGPWTTDTVNKHWSTLHNRVDCIVRAWYIIHSAFLHLKSLGVQQHHYFVDYSHYRMYKPPFINIKMSDCDFDKNFIDKGLDNSHPGPNSHRTMASIIFEDIKHMGINII